jgi:hypothetical protein
MALTSFNDARETYRETYKTSFNIGYAIRRKIHYYILSVAVLMVAAPAFWWFWFFCWFALYAVDTNIRLRTQDRFGRGRGPYLKKKAGMQRGQIEEWSVISTPLYRGGDGIWPLGNNMHTNEEIWVSDDYMRAHILLSGTTGSGKTVSMCSTFIYVAFCSDSGIVMIDGKADPKTWFEIYSMAVATGRADDFLVLNFVVGETQEAEFTFSSSSEKELWEEFQSIESNTFNIFGTGTPDTLFEIGSGLMGDDAQGDNKMWVERAQALLRSMLKGLGDLRDQGQLKISIATLQEYMSLERLSELEQNEDISEIARQQIGAVLNEIAGYRDAMKVEDPQRRAALLADQPSKQFAFLHMQFGALFAMLIGTYGHIANVEYSDIWTPDVIRNRRILLVMLPALEKAPTSLAQLGRMATSAIKSALSQSISGSLTGRKSELVDRRPTNSLRAMILIYDEAASYIQAGTADVAAQSRSLGACNVFSSQEWSSLQQAGEIEAKRLISNTGLKIVLKNEDKETADHFMDAVGNAHVTKGGGKRFENGKWEESEQRVEEVPRVTFQEMMNLAEGQAYMKWRDTMLHVRMPFVGVKATEQAQRNDLVPIPGSMVTDRVKMRLTRQRSIHSEETELPALHLPECLVDLLGVEEDKDLRPQYALLEKIIRNVHRHQIVIPWKEAPPPRGKVKATEMFPYYADRLATDLMWTMGQAKNDPVISLMTNMHENPDTRFILPFMPHEKGLISSEIADDISGDSATAIDESIETSNSMIAEMLSRTETASTESLDSSETSTTSDNDTSEPTDTSEAKDNIANPKDEESTDNFSTDDENEDAYGSLDSEDTNDTVVATPQTNFFDFLGMPEDGADDEEDRDEDDEEDSIAAASAEDSGTRHPKKHFTTSDNDSLLESLAMNNLPVADRTNETSSSTENNPLATESDHPTNIPTDDADESYPFASLETGGLQGEEQEPYHQGSNQEEENADSQDIVESGLNHLAGLNEDETTEIATEEEQAFKEHLDIEVDGSSEIDLTDLTNSEDDDMPEDSFTGEVEAADTSKPTLSTAEAPNAYGILTSRLRSTKLKPRKPFKMPD